MQINLKKKKPFYLTENPNQAQESGIYKERSNL